MSYWTVVWFGNRYDGPVGPWDSEKTAEAAVERWWKRGGWEQNADNLRVVGPFATAAIAKSVSISDYADHYEGRVA